MITCIKKVLLRLKEQPKAWEMIVRAMLALEMKKMGDLW